MSSRRIALLGLVLFAFPSFAQLRPSGLPKTEQVQNTVREFCRQDFLGARLSGDGWNRVKRLTTWKDNPAWRTFHVISRYDQTSVSTGFHSARVGVKYIVLGRFELGAGYSSLNESENAEFKLRETEEEWRIDDTDPELLEPQISRQTALQWLQEKQKTVTDAGEKASIETALKALQPAK
jgi:hypothetical protein